MPCFSAPRVCACTNIFWRMQGLRVFVSKSLMGSRSLRFLTQFRLNKRKTQKSFAKNKLLPPPDILTHQKGTKPTAHFSRLTTHAHSLKESYNQRLCTYSLAKTAAQANTNRQTKNFCRKNRKIFLTRPENKICHIFVGHLFV